MQIPARRTPVKFCTSFRRKCDTGTYLEHAPHCTGRRSTFGLFAAELGKRYIGLRTPPPASTRFPRPSPSPSGAPPNLLTGQRSAITACHPERSRDEAQRSHGGVEG